MCLLSNWEKTTASDKNKLPITFSNFFTRLRNVDCHFPTKVDHLKSALSKISQDVVKEKWTTYLEDIRTFIDFLILLWRAHPSFIPLMRKSTIRFLNYPEFIMLNPQERSMRISRDPDQLSAQDRQKIANLKASLDFSVDAYPLKITNDDLEKVLDKYLRTDTIKD